jgi:hypothetical protein
MGVMTSRAFLSPLVPAVFNAQKRSSVGIRVFKIGVTPEAQLSGSVERKKLNVVGVVYGRAVAVFAFDTFMSRGVEQLNIFLVAFNTGFSALVLDRKVFPLLNITKAMIAVGEIFSVDTEVIGNQNKLGDQDRSDQSDCYP